MDVKNILPVTEIRKKLFQILKEIEKTGAHYMITEKGKPKAVMMSAEEYESWIETFEVMKEFPDLDEEIKEAKSDYRKGNYVTLDQIIKKREFIIADKSGKKYGLSGRHSKKSSKRSRKAK